MNNEELRLAQTEEELKSEKHFLGNASADFYLKEIQSMEFLGKIGATVKLDLVMMDVNTNSILTVDISSVSNKVRAWEIKIMREDDVLYMRQIEGHSEEIRAHVIYFAYKDIMNFGMQMMYAIVEENKSK